MTKHLLLGLLLASATSSFAQPTLTKATNAPVAGDTFYAYNADTTGVDSGAAGASITWDMSALVKVDSDTTFFLNCTATPYCDSFPGASLAMLNDSDWAYGFSGTDGVQMIGVYSEGNYLHFDNPHRISSYPLTYGSTYKDTFTTQLNFMGIDIFVTGRSTNTADGWGTLKLPNGTFPNVLRVQTTLIQKDSANFMGIPQVTETQTESYSWYMAGFHSPLLTLDYDTAGTGTLYLAGAKYYKATPPPPTTGIGDVAGNNGLHIYPNPASGVVNIQLSGRSERTTVSVLDMAGREVSGTVAEHSNNVTLPLNDIPAGTYMLRIIADGQAPETAKLIVR